MVDSGLDELLKRHGVDLSSEDVLAEFDAALSKVPQDAPLSASETAFLSEHSGPGSEAVVRTWGPEREREQRARLAAQNVQALIAESLSVKEAAEAIGVDRSVMQRNITNHRVYSYRIAGRRHRVPRWQITAGQLLPGSDVIARAIPEGLSPLSVAGFMSSPQPEFGDQNAVDWLAAGNDPTPVAELLADLDIW